MAPSASPQPAGQSRAPHRDQVSGPDVEGGGVVEVPVILQSSDLQNARRV